MKLFVRLLWIFLKHIFLKNPIANIKKSHTKQFRVLPCDIDINLHMTNSRYYTFADIARVDMLFKNGLFDLVRKNHWLPMLTATEMSFIRAIKTFTKFTIETKIVGWDEKHLFFVQRFSVDNKVCAIATMSGVLVCNHKVVPTKTIMTELGYEPCSPELPDYIKKWKTCLDTKKNHNHDQNTFD